MSTPTPTPWYFDGAAIRASASGQLALIITTNGETQEARANGALIVRAVNAHEALVAAVEHALRYMEARGTYDTREAAAPLRAALAQVKP